MTTEKIFQQVKSASGSLALMTDAQRNEVLLAVADAIIENKDRLLAANAEDGRRPTHFTTGCCSHPTSSKALPPICAMWRSCPRRWTL